MVSGRGHDTRADLLVTYKASPSISKGEVEVQVEDSARMKKVLSCVSGKSMNDGTANAMSK